MAVTKSFLFAGLVNRLLDLATYSRRSLGLNQVRLGFRSHLELNRAARQIISSFVEFLLQFSRAELNGLQGVSPGDVVEKEFAMGVQGLVADDVVMLFEGVRAAPLVQVHRLVLYQVSPTF